MDNRKHYRCYSILGWALTLVGSVLWTYGYFEGDSYALLNWSTFAPHWLAEYLPNWQCESGLLLSLVGSVPVYYVQIKTAQLRINSDLGAS